ncbi:MAG: hypothetical protein GF405_09940 [Candidatus Eisenbacteria bacterium]|nr:hypothetical protein [Candidatus Eisenbacteria bacterium]
MREKSAAAQMTVANTWRVPLMEVLLPLHRPFRFRNEDAHLLNIVSFAGAATGPTSRGLDSAGRDRHTRRTRGSQSARCRSAPGRPQDVVRDGENPLCVTDVGSTTTKAMLFVRDGDRWSYERAEAPTTVEAPHEDVTIGVLQALRGLEEACGRRLLEGERPAVPFLSTSSAGGGLAMVVTGLVEELTARSARSVALGAGAIVLDVVAMNDGRTAYRKIDDLKAERPDIILLAGGFDGEAISGPVHLAELLVESDIHPKLNPDARLPVVYAGNMNARDYVGSSLGERFLFRPVENIRPNESTMNPGPARRAIQGLFMDHVMSQAPGYAALASWVDAPVRPTPAAFLKILSVLSSHLEGTVLAVDIGGATTDVFTARGDETLRTVSANLGMSYSILNVIDTAGLESVTGLLEGEADARDVMNAVGNKYVRPTSLPETRADAELEWAVATAAVREAVREHMQVMASLPPGERPGAVEPRTVLGRGDDDGGLRLRGYDMVIGSGGILSHSSRGAAAAVLLDALRPEGDVELAVDSAFMFPHLGVIADVDAELARGLLEELGIVRLGRVSSAGENLLAGGRGREVELGFAPDAESGVVLRRPEGGEAARARQLVPEEVELPPSRRGGEQVVRHGEHRVKRELAIEGEVFVSPGDRVEPADVVARSVQEFLRPFFLDVADVMKVEPEELSDVLVKQPGDEVERQEVIAKQPWRLGRPSSYRSPVEGTIEKILPNGTLVVRERPELSRVLTTVSVADELGVHRSKMRPYLKVEVGEELERDQWLAARITSNARKIVRSPVRGHVERIDEKLGMVMIEPLRQEDEVAAWVPGTVLETTSRGPVIATSGTEITGVWGTGDAVFGPLVPGEPAERAIAVVEHADAATLERLQASGAVGVIAAGGDLIDLRDGGFGLTVVVVHGFGRRTYSDAVRDALERHEGALASIDGTTQLRVGVRRPRAILQE